MLRNKIYLKPNIIVYDQKTKSIQDSFKNDPNELKEFLESLRKKEGMKKDCVLEAEKDLSSKNNIK